MELAFILGHPLKLLALIAIIVIVIVIAEQYKKRSEDPVAPTDDPPERDRSG